MTSIERSGHGAWSGTISSDGSHGNTRTECSSNKTPKRSWRTWPSPGCHSTRRRPCSAILSPSRSTIQTIPLDERAILDFQLAEFLEQLFPHDRRKPVSGACSIDQPLALVISEDEPHRRWRVVLLQLQGMWPHVSGHGATSSWLAPSCARPSSGACAPKPPFSQPPTSCEYSSALP